MIKNVVFIDFTSTQEEFSIIFLNLTLFTLPSAYVIVINQVPKV